MRKPSPKALKDKDLHTYFKILEEKYYFHNTPKVEKELNRLVKEVERRLKKKHVSIQSLNT